MAVKSGSDFESHYNGSTGSDGETREGNYHGYSDGESVRINNAKDGHGSFMAKGGTSNTQAGKDHLHFFDNPAPGQDHHKEGYETGQRLVQDKETGYLTEKLGDAVRNFLGF
jgi:hypothetical protein